MIIAISADSNQAQDSMVAHHFGRCPFFAFVEVNNNKLETITLIENPFFESHHPGQVPEFIKDQGANIMLSGGIGHRAIQFFKDFRIETATGANGTVAKATADYLNGNLSDASFCAESEAYHDGHHHHGSGHEHNRS